MKLRPAAERAVRSGHPWVFSEGIEKLGPAGRAGDLAMIYSRATNKLMAIGLYDPGSPMRIKVLHHGGPRSIDAAFFRQGLQRARELRRPLFTATNAYRMLFGENDGFPALVVDVYDRVAVMKVYSPIWFTRLGLLAAEVAEVAGSDAVVVRFSRMALAAGPPVPEGSVLSGALSTPEVVFHEHEVKLKADLLHGHKTGFFLDHRANRHKVGQMAKGKRVLDVFSYAGGFAVHALCGGAVEATSVDISAPALEAAMANAELNGVGDKLRTVQGDAFQRMREMAKRGERFDIVVVDPPSFAKSRAEAEGALGKYGELAALGAQLVRPGGTLVLASCSSRVGTEDFLSAHGQAFRQQGIRAELLELTAHDIDHPIGFPEGAYLKTAYYKVGSSV